MQRGFRVVETHQTAPCHNKFQTLEAVAKPMSLLDGLPGSHPKDSYNLQSLP